MLTAEIYSIGNSIYLL